MSDSPSTKQRPQLPFSGIIVIVGVLGLLFYEPPLRSLRPDVPDPTASTAGSFAEELVEARLWQDPLGPVRDFHAQQAKDGAEPTVVRPWDEMSQRLSGRLAEAPNARVRVLAVMVQGGPYAEQVERRRRDRVSVISGLSAEGYESENSDHLGYFETRWDLKAPELVGSAGTQLLIPYEWLEFIPEFRSSNPRRDSILLLWLDESSFMDRPLARLESLLSALVPEDARMEVEFDLLGPATSEGLGAMLDEVCDIPARPCEVGLAPGQPARTAQTSSSGSADLAGGEPTDSTGFDVFLARDILWETDGYLDAGLPELSAEAREALEGALAPAAAAALDRPFADSFEGIAEILSERLPNIDDSDPRWAENVTASWLLQTGNWSLVNDEQAIENLLVVVDDYLDDDLPNLDPSAQADLDESLVGAFREALRRPHDQMLSTLGSRLHDLLPTVIDSDPEWARVSVEQWYGALITASFRATQNLLSRAGFYADSGRDPDAPEAESQLRWGLLQRLEAASDLDQIADIIESTLFGGDEIDPDDRRLAESLAATWLAESGTLPITSDRVAVETLLVGVDEYLDYGLPERDASARADLNDALVDVYRGLPEDADSDALATLARALEASFPSVEDSDSSWAETATSLWYDRLSWDSLADDLIGVPGAVLPDTKSPEDLVTSSSILTRLHVYSSRATAVTDYLGGYRKTRSLDVLGARLASFNRTVEIDEVLVDALMSELGRRAFDPCRHTLVLVGESDTSYSRTLADSFERRLTEAPPVDLERWFPGATICSEAQRGLGVMRMTYLRGLDGALPGEPPTKSSASSIPSTLSATTSPEAARAAAEQQERASGRGQIDYFRRLAAALEQQELDDRPIGAIGVVGSDIYDKLVVLQALRPRFPGTLFFTTDLDARLLHPTVYPYARNLLVASQYGLEVSSHFQGFFPPFRDGYQTSTFVAARWAVATGSRRGTLSAAIGTAEPRLFEIGRDQAYDITPVSSDAVGTAEPRLFEIGRDQAYDITPVSSAPRTNNPRLHPTPVRPLPDRWAIGKLAALLVLATTLVMPSWRPLRWFFTEHSKIEARDKHDAYRVIGLAVLMAMLLWAVLSADTLSGAGEPFASLGGISAWPTELLRALATTLAVAFMLIGLAAIRSNNGELEEQCAFQTQRKESPKSFPVEEIPDDVKKWTPSGWWSWRKAASISGWNQTHRPAFSLDDEGSGTARIWDEYRMLGRVNNRTLRFVPMAGLYALLAIVIVRLADVSRAPVRGTPAQYLDWGLFFFSFATFTLLVFFVVDATRLCRRFIAILSSRKTDWPTELCERLGLQRDLDADDVADYIDIRFIGERTGVIAPLVIYPFVVLFLLLISRNGYFDNWSWEPPVVIAYGILSAFAIFSALVMRRAAEDARKRALVNMRRRISRALGEKRKDKNDYVRRLEMLVDEIRSIDEGAFAPWSRHPVVRAVLIPFGGVGIVALIDILSTLGL